MVICMLSSIMLLLTFVIALYLLLFFFSSRRRHTRCLSDWSSDVCSSDLGDGLDSRPDRLIVLPQVDLLVCHVDEHRPNTAQILEPPADRQGVAVIPERLRSEERRVGKECRSRWGAHE